MFKPLSDNVLIRRIEPKSRTESGLYLPEKNALPKPTEALVEAVGPGRMQDDGTREPMPVKQGDRVMFGKYTGHEVKIDDVEHIVCKVTDLLGVLE